ncbi:MAG: acyl-CoA dehydrogenase family protein [Pseudonocardiales bacterium]|nr:acyl-CoA dehydrogenase family protein [Pseudonocardiales bacterium]
MIGFGLSEEHRALRKTVAEFARTEVAPVAARNFEAAAFPYDLVASMGRMGLYGLPFGEDVGGQGGDLFGLCVALEEIARVDSSSAVALSAGVSLGALPLDRFGTAEQRAAWLPALCAGEALAAFGLTEPEAGTDAGATRTRAVLDGDEWVIDGAKSFITNSGTAITRLVTVTAVTGERADGRPEISTIVVPSGTPGFTVDPPYSKVGWCASDTHGLSFDGCRVPAGNLLGERGRGLAQFLTVLDESRVALAAVGTGLAQGCVDECVRYARERVAFGRPLAAHQAVAFRIADMEARAHTARLAWYDAASRLVAGEPFARQAAVAKLVSSEAAMDNARDATQVFGGYGFLNETAVARFYRDAKILEIGEGTSEVQRMVIARHLGLG